MRPLARRVSFTESPTSRFAPCSVDAMPVGYDLVSYRWPAGHILRAARHPGCVCMKEAICTMEIDKRRRYELQQQFPQRADESDPDYQHRFLSEASVPSAVTLTSSLIRKQTPEERKQRTDEQEAKKSKREWRPISEGNLGRSEWSQAQANRERGFSISIDIPNRLLAISRHYSQWEGELIDSYIDRLEYQLSRDKIEGISRK